MAFSRMSLEIAMFEFIEYSILNIQY